MSTDRPEQAKHLLGEGGSGPGPEDLLAQLRARVRRCITWHEQLVFLCESATILCENGIDEREYEADRARLALLRRVERELGGASGTERGEGT